ncbi:MAG: hypothetical protein IT385_01555 [Deltaproteobacteria bacterium]|nr:hypothetical protein [Deltaproteobacteria bacterium]
MKRPTFVLLPLLGALALGLGGCPADTVNGNPEVRDTVDGGDTADTTIDTEDTSTPEDIEVAEEVEDVDVQDGETIELTEPGRFTLGEADLDDEFVFKGVWAGEAGRIVAVGNDGVVATRDPEGDWTILTRAEGASVLNAIHGHDGQSLWAVGHAGAILPGSVTSFGDSASCERDEDCADADQCTIDRCVDNVCVAEPTGAAGCCGSALGEWGFDSGSLSGWAVDAATRVGPWTWQAVSVPDRAVSGAWSLYFGNPAAVPPTYDGAGVQVAASVVSPPVKLPLTGTATLEFNVFLDAEPDLGFDNLVVELQVGAERTKVWSKADLGTVPTAGFVAAEADVSSFRGKSVQVRVTFDSSDGTFNSFEGPYLDDVRFETSCSTSGAAASSNGPTLWGVYAFAKDIAYAVGRDGTILTWDGSQWGPARGADPSAVWNAIVGGGDERLSFVGNGGLGVASGAGGLRDITTGTGEHLHGLHTVDGETWFGVGDRGTIVRGTGTSWTKDDTLGLTVSLRDVHGRSNDDVYAVGYQGTAVHWDGREWSTVATDTTVNLLGVWVDGSGLVTAVGKNGIVLTGNADNGLVTSGTYYSGGDLNDLWGTADGSFLMAVGTGGRVMVRTATGGWEVVDATTSQTLEAIWGTAADEVWVVGRSGTAIHWDGEVFTRASTPISASLNSVWGNAADRYYAVGTGGTLLVFTGGGWEAITTPSLTNLRGIQGRSANDVWAVGAQGKVIHFAGLGWGASRVEGIPNADGGEDPITEELHAVWAAAADDAWAVGQDGRILRWDGAMWNIVETDWPITLRGIYGLAHNDVWAVGNEGHVIHWNGEAWEKVETGSIATLYAIHGDGAGHVVVVGDLGTVLELERD